MKRLLLLLSLLATASAGFLQAQSCSITEASPLPAAILNKYYERVFVVDDTACGPFRDWVLTSGAVPPGMTFTSDGTLVGRPTAAGVYGFTVRMLDSPTFSIRKSFSLEVQPAATLMKRILTTGRQGIGYSDFVENIPIFPNYGKVLPYYTITAGALPGGLTLNSSTGEITGTPAAAGSFDFVVRGQGDLNRISTSYRLVIHSANGPDFTTVGTPGGVVGSAYNATISTVNATGVALWDTPLPAGLSFNTATGQITGTPSVAGAFPIVFQAFGTGGRVALRTLVLRISDMTGFTFDTGTNPRQATYGTAYASRIIPTGGVAPYTATLSSTSLAFNSVPSYLSVENGLVLRATTVPNPATPASFIVTVTDAAGRTSSRTVVLNTSGFTATFPSTTDTVPMTVNQPTSASLVTPTGGLAPYTYRLSPGFRLPAGMTLNTTTGAISGTPTEDGNFVLQYQIFDSSNGVLFSNNNFVLNVADPLQFTTPSALPSGRAASSYSFRLRASGGYFPTNFLVTAGALPSGLTLNSSTGEISGTFNSTAPAPPTANFSVTTTDVAGRTATRAFTLAQLTGFQWVTAEFPFAYQGASYTAPIQAQVVGVSGFSYSLQSGALPGGLAINQTNSTVEGIPTAKGTFTFTLRASAVGGSFVDRAFTIRVEALPQLDPTNYPSGAVDTAYEGTVGGTGFGPLIFLPVGFPTDRGLVFDPATGRIYGQPNQTGLVSFSIRVIDRNGRLTDNISRSFTIFNPLLISNHILSNGTQSQLYADQVVASSLTPGAITYSLVGGALPTGTTLTAGNGVISGTTSALGTFNFRIRATHVNGYIAEQDYQVIVSPPLVSTTTLRQCTLGIFCASDLTTTGGRGEKVWSITSVANPAFLNVDTAPNDYSGIPIGPAGSTNLTFVVRDADDRTLTLPLTQVVNAPVSFVTSTLPNGETNVAYSQTLVTAGGTTPLSFSVTGGALPGGITLNPGTGVLAGTTTASGAFSFTALVTDANGATAQRTFSLTILPTLSITTTSLPNGQIGTPYSQTVQVAGAVGGQTLFVSAGALPNGFNLDSTSGLISGNPSQVGTSNFTVSVTDGQGRTALRALSIIIGSPFSITTTSPLPFGSVNTNYSQAIQTANASGQVTLQVTLGALPTGISISGTSLTGTPTAAGTFNFTLQATDGSGAIATRAYALTIHPELQISTATLPNGTVGLAYNQTIATLGAVSSQNLLVTVGSLPNGLSLDSTTGAITGSPTTAQTSTFTVRLTDGLNRATTRVLSIQVVNGVSITTTTLPNGETNVAYSQTIAASGGTAPRTFSLASGNLPGGITLNSTTGTIAGTASAAGTFGFEVRVVDVNGSFAQRAFSLTILPTLSITTTSLPNGQVGSAYSQVVQVTGAVNGQSLDLTAGFLPGGLTLDSTSGAITGTPNASGSFTFTVQVADGQGRFASRQLSIVIGNQLSITTTSPLPAGTVGVAYSQPINTANANGQVTMTFTGTLPTGTNLTGTTITGTPNTPGTFNFVINASDASGSTATRAFQVTINPVLQITTTSLPNGQIGTAYSQTVQVAGAVSGQTLSLTAGALPTGFNLDSTSGLISGTPSQVGTSNFTVSVTDGLGRSAQQALAITIGSQFSITTASPLPFGSVNSSYSQAIQTANATGQVTLQVTIGALPQGLGITGTSLTGTPTAAGTFNFTLRATDSANATATRAYTLTIHPELQISTASLPNGTVGVAYNQTITTLGAVSGQTLQVIVGALPNGLVLNSTTGVISNPPTTVQTSPFTVQLTDGLGRTTSRALSIQVVSGLTITTASPLPAGTVGTAYAQSIDTSNASGPVTLTPTTGLLPPGITINGNALSGTPTQAGVSNFTLQAADTAGGVTTKAFQITVNPALTITTNTLPNGQVGTAYNQTVAATGIVGSSDWLVFAGQLPAGLTLDSGNGAITGNPTTTGTASFTVQVRDSLNRTALKVLSITIGSQFSISTGSPLPFGSVGTAYTQAIQTTNASGTVTMTTTGTLPTGITLTGTTLTGTPTVAGTFNFTVNASDASGAQASQAYALTIHPTLSITTLTLPNGNTAVSYSQTVQTAGAVNGATISLFSGSLPNGLTLASATGVISGTPTQLGPSSFVLLVTDGLGRTAQRNLSITIGTQLTITNNSPLPSGTVGAFYSQTFQTSGASGQVTFSSAGTLPPGTSLTGAVLSGTPTTAGTFNFTINAVDAAGAQTGKVFNATINSQLQITTLSLPNGQVGSSYSQTVQVTGALNGQTLVVLTGALPAGLTLNSSSGLISGTPTQTGTSNFNVQVTDGAGRTAQQALAITIGSQFSITTTSPLPAGTVGSNYSLTFQVANASGAVTYSLETGPPPGLTLSGATLSGTPTTAGTFDVLLIAQDASGASDFKTLQLTVNPALSITTISLPNGQVGTAYNQTVQTAGAVNGTTFTLFSGTLPLGLNLNSSTGLISGTPSQTGSQNFTVRVVDGLNRSAQRAFSINTTSTFTITTAGPLPVGTVGSLYNLPIQTSNGSGSISFGVTAGALPAGMTLSSGTLTGTPTTSGDNSFTITATDGSNATSSVAYQLYVRPILTITTLSLPNGLVGAGYSATVQVTGAVNTQLLTIVPGSGTLPPGLGLNSTSGLISGTPSAAGSFSFTVRVTDESNRTFDRAFTVVIGQFIITTTSLPVGIQGVSYSQSLASTGGTGQVQFTTNSPLPSGLALSTTGTLSGIPSQTGTFPLTVTARDAQTNTANQTLSLVVNAPLSITTTSLPPGAVNVAYAQQVATSGAVGSVTFSLTAGALPPGFNLNSTTGLISGTTQTNDIFTFTVRAQDSAGQVATRALSITTNGALFIYTTNLVPGVQGTPYSAPIETTGQIGARTFSIDGGALPPGMSLNSTTGILGGTPTAVGLFNFIVGVRDSQNRYDSRPLTLTIFSPFSITTLSLPSGTVGTFYSSTVNTIGASGGVTFALAGGTLPPGLGLGSGTGTISGTPTTNGSFSFTVRATDGTGRISTQPYQVTILSPLTLTGTPPNGTVGISYAAQLTATGQSGQAFYSLSQGSLPQGLSLGSTSGSITGIPTTAGTFSFTAQVTDGLSRTASLSLTIVISPALQISGIFPTGTVGTAYTSSASAIGAVNGTTFDVTSGSLPPGLNLTASTGAVGGTPTTNGSFSFTLRVTDGLGRTASQAFQVTILSPLTLSGNTPNATVGIAYVGQLTAAGQSGSATYSVTQGSLPPGLALLSSTGAITGTPTTAGTFNFTAQVSDSLSRIATLSATISVAPPLQISSIAPPIGYTGEAYLLQLTPIGGLAPYQWSLVSGSLPGNVLLNGQTGLISGTPTSVSVHTFRVRLTDARGTTAEADMAIEVRPGLVINTFNFGATRGVAFSGNLLATGGVGPYTWSLASGNLPNGITFTSLGLVSGTTNDPEGVYTFTFRVTDSRQVSKTQVMTFGVQPPALTPLTISPNTVPNAVVNRPYSVLLSGSGGNGPYTFTITGGSTPNGVSLSGSGLLSGVPTTPGTFNFSVNMTDANGRAAGEAYVIRVDAPLTISPDTIPGGVINTSYSTGFSATGGRAPYTFSLTGNTPAGITFNPATGSLGGTPTEAGTFGLTVEVVDASGTRVSKGYSLVINGLLTITTNSPLPEGAVGSPYSVGFAASGGTLPFTWAITGGSLPGGVGFDSATGAAAGTPTADGTSSFTVEVTDARGLKASRGYSITIFPPLSINTPPTATLTVGTAASLGVSATGGKAPYTFSVLSGNLPPGVGLAADGTLTGTPTSAGTFAVTIEVVDALRIRATRQFSFTVASNLLISTTTLPDGVAGAAYASSVSAIGGTAPLTFSLTAGSLPPGLGLASGGAITGTPTASGTFNFTVQAQDTAGATGSRALSITITLPSLPTTTVTGVPGTITQGQQPSLAISIAQAFPVDVAGVLTLTFTNDAVNPADDPAVRFVASGTRTLAFTIPAGQTVGQFGAGGSAFQVGTVAGAIRITSVLTPVGGTAQPGPTANSTLARIVPQVTQSSVQQAGSTFTVNLAGFSNTRELSQAVIRLNPVPGANLTTTQITVPLTDVFNTYYRSAASVPFGGQFSLGLPFTVAGDPNAIASVDITLTNVVGSSSNTNLRLR